MDFSSLSAQRTAVKQRPHQESGRAQVTMLWCGNASADSAVTWSSRWIHSTSRPLSRHDDVVTMHSLEAGNVRRGLQSVQQV